MSKEAKEFLATKGCLETYTHEEVIKLLHEYAFYLYELELKQKWGNTFNKLKAEVEPYKNTLVLDDFNQVARLVDVIEGEDDFYYVMDKAKGIEHHSCVGTFIPLKGFIDYEKYERLVSIWNLNHIEKAV